MDGTTKARKGVSMEPFNHSLLPLSGYRNMEVLQEYTGLTDENSVK